MDAAAINAKIYYGRSRVAAKLGLPCSVYRPNNPTNPFSNYITRMNCSFNAADQNYLKPNLYGKPIWFGDFDGTQTQPGDYIARESDDSVWFIADQQFLLPIVAIDCNASVTVARQPSATTCGPQPYSGISAPPLVLGTSDTPWPASILVGGRTQSAIGLPGDVKEAGWRILLPSSVPINIQSSDIMGDDKGRRFAVESAELTDLGWRITANEVHA